MRSRSSEGAAARILVIEDNEENLALMTYLLRAFGHEPIAARDGREGIAAARRERPDLLLVDLQMPGIDGYEVLRLLRADPGWRAVPVVAVSALAMVGDREKVLAAGFDGYIAKPIVPESVVADIERFLGPPAGRDGAAGGRGRA